MRKGGGMGCQNNKIKTIEWSCLAVSFLALVWLFFKVTQLIHGPFIFADEPEYHWLASEIFHYQKFYGHQYNPLYPLLIAPTYLASNLVFQFDVIKLVNGLLYCSIIFPTYLVAREILQSRMAAFGAGIVAAFAPIGAYSHLVWAESVYYPLICWSYCFVFKYMKQGRNQDALIAGLFIGLAYLAKQAALIFLVSTCAVMLATSIFKREKISWQPIILLGVGAALLVLPWMLRNMLADVGALGYSSMFSLLVKEFLADPFRIANNVLLGIGYSFSYWIFVYWGGGFILLLLAAFVPGEGRDEIPIVSLARIVLLHTALLMLFSEVFLVAYGKMASANGRYVDAIYPIAVVLIFWMASRNWAPKSVIVWGAAVASFAILLVFSPFIQVEAYGAVNNSGVNILNFLWPERFFWQVQIPAVSDRILLALGLAILVILILHLKNRALWLFVPLAILAGLGAHAQVIRLGETTNEVNGVFRELNRQSVPSAQLLLDAKLNETSVPFYTKYWYPKNYNQIEIANKSIIRELEHAKQNMPSSERRARFLISNQDLSLRMAFSNSALKVYALQPIR